MQEVDFNPDHKFWEYKANTIVKNVPISFFDGDLEAAEYISKRKNGHEWRANVKRLIDQFDFRKVGQFFYCRKCRRMEDGAHRLAISKIVGLRFVDVRVGGTCYKNYIKGGRMIRSDSTFENSFLKAMDSVKTKHPLDKKWLAANMKDKWPFFSPLIDFRNKFFLDVGSHVGYSVVEAWSRGAKLSWGIEIREDLIKVARKIKTKLSIRDDRIKFINADWREYNPEGKKFDIVMCSGLLHYFSISEYEALFNKILDVCDRQLVIEMRLRNRPTPVLTLSGVQTLPSDSWLIVHLRKKGFKVRSRFVRDSGKRELWVVDRGKSL